MPYIIMIHRLAVLANDHMHMCDILLLRTFIILISTYYFICKLPFEHCIHKVFSEAITSIKSSFDSEQIITKVRGRIQRRIV